jgi:hypothetical protein
LIKAGAINGRFGAHGSVGVGAAGDPVVNGSIIHLHFTTFSVNNVSALIDNLNKRGFEMVTVSQLFA